MIYSLKGTLTEKDIGVAVVECGGVGYLMSITGQTLSLLPDVGREVQIYTYMHVKEDDVELFGFYEKQERDCFKVLLSVNGVGPKMALSILTELSPSQLSVAIVSGDYQQLTRAGGVGPKLAQRIVLELKDKISKDMPELLNGKSVTPVQAGTGEKTAEVITALLALGYTQHEAKRAAGTLDLQNLSVEQAIKAALAQLMG